MAKVTGPLYSVSARGTIGKSFTFSIWKGIQYVREWFSPANPKTVKQVNIRTALSLSVALWQTLGEATQEQYNEAAKGSQMSGYNYFVEKALKAYMDQLGIDLTPASVTVVGAPPDQVYTWVSV